MNNKPEIKYRTPDIDHITVVIDSEEKIFTNEEYIEIIRTCSRVEGSGSEYIEARNKILKEYFINGPKEQFSW